MQNRKRKLVIPGTCKQAEIDLLAKKILVLDGVTGLKQEAMEIEVEYQFPLACCLDIWKEVKSSQLSDHFSFFGGLLENLKANAEFNEQQHAEKCSNWFSYTRDIYAYHHLVRQKVASHKHLWRRHQKTQ